MPTTRKNQPTMQTAARRSRFVPADARPRTALRAQARAAGRPLAPAAPDDQGPRKRGTTFTLAAGARYIRKYGKAATLAVLATGHAPANAREFRARVKAAKQNVGKIRLTGAQLARTSNGFARLRGRA